MMASLTLHQSLKGGKKFSRDILRKNALNCRFTASRRPSISSFCSCCSKGRRVMLALLDDLGSAIKMGEASR